MQPSYMGQDLLNPPSVEGWHTGSEWINSGALMSRINFVAEQVGNTSLPGVQAIISRLKAQGTLEPEQMVDSCLDLLGPVEVDADTKKELTDQAKQWGQIRWDSAAQAQTAEKHTGELLQLIVATREFQFA
jgi:oxalate decarboxylase/phosphoglucose isomerase-like protein (cupin superfamily)